MSASVAIPLSSPRLRSEEHTSELQSHSDLVCRLLLEKKNFCTGQIKELETFLKQDEIENKNPTPNLAELARESPRRIETINNAHAAYAHHGDRLDKEV